MKHIEGPRRLSSGNQIFFDIWLLTDSIPSPEAYEILKKMNNSNYNYTETHYFDSKHKCRFIGFPNPEEETFMFMDPKLTDEILAQKIVIAYEKAHTINTGWMWRYFRFDDRNAFPKDGFLYDDFHIDNTTHEILSEKGGVPFDIRQDLKKEYNMYHPNWERQHDTLREEDCF